MSDNNVIAASIADLCFLSPIWLKYKILLVVSAKKESLSATIFSLILPKQFKREIVL
jgi:hypothetical protein